MTAAPRPPLEYIQGLREPRRSEAGGSYIRFKSLADVDLKAFVRPRS